MVDRDDVIQVSGLHIASIMSVTEVTGRSVSHAAADVSISCAANGRAPPVRFFREGEEHLVVRSLGVHETYVLLPTPSVRAFSAFGGYCALC
jgi:hypothetical protein